jgi:hypothetical protein
MGLLIQISRSVRFGNDPTSETNDAGDNSFVSFTADPDPEVIAAT